MTPRWLHWPAAISGYSDLVSGTTTSDITNNYYVTHTNINGDAIWNGKGASNSFQFTNTGSPNNIVFYFLTEADKNAALAAYSAWKIVGTDGTDVIITPADITSGTTYRVRFPFPDISISFTALTTYTIQGQP